MKKHQIATVPILLFLSLPAGARSPFMQSLGLEEGLSSNYVKEIVQDKNKFIWFATNYGLNRFNGRDFNIYTSEPGKGRFQGNEISGIAADMVDNTVWIATRWTGVSVFDCHTETFTSYNHDAGDPGSISSDNVTDILASPGGEVWLTTSDTGLNRFDKNSLRFERYDKARVPGLPSNRMLSVSMNPSCDTLYIGHMGDGLTLLSTKDMSVRNFRHDPSDGRSLPNDTVNCVFTDSEGNIWVGTGGGLALFDYSSGEFRNFNTIENVPSTLARQVVYSICQTDDGTIWVGTTSDLCHFEATNVDDLFEGRSPISQTHIKDPSTGLSNPSVTYTYKDSFGNLWVASNGGGVRFVSHIAPFFHSWHDASVSGPETGLSDKDARAICTDKEGNLWIGTDGGGVNMYRNGINTKIYRSADSPISSDAVCVIMRDSEDKLWFGNAFAGIDIYDGRGGFTHYTPETGSPNIHCLFEDSARNVWIGTDGGVQSYNLNTKATMVLDRSNSALLSDQIRSIAQDANGYIWIGTLNRGVAVYNPEMKTITNINTDNGFFCDMIKYLFRDSRNRMWVATTDGLAVFPPGDTAGSEVFTTGSGLACSYILAIEEDGEGNIWFSTNYGISCFLEKENRFLNYSHADGVPVGSFMIGSVAKTADGTIWFGSQNGVCYFDPAERPGAMDIPPVIFTDFMVHGKLTGTSGEDMWLPVSSGEALTLRADQNKFSVSFSVMDYALRGLVEYSYRLEGLSDSWLDLDDQNQVRFLNIPYRKYTLNVKARLKNQYWPEADSRLPLHIHPPVWLSWWAWCIYIAAILSTIIFLVYTYLRRLELRHTMQLEKENMRIQQEVNEEHLRFYTHIVQELHKESQDRADNEFLDKIIKYIEANLDDRKIDNASIVNLVGMSYSTVYRKVKAATGMSINEFKRKVLMQNAEKWLLSGQYTISEICYKVGFNSVSHFRECFREEYGCLPSEFIRRVKQTGIVDDTPGDTSV